MAFIIDDILLAPCSFVAWLGRTLQDQAEAELTDESAIHEQLLNLQTRLELGEISEPEYLRQENELMGRINAIHKYKESRREG